MFSIRKTKSYEVQKDVGSFKNNDLETASKEMIDSNWHKQTTKRCESLANVMKNANN